MHPGSKLYSICVLCRVSHVAKVELSSTSATGALRQLATGSGEVPGYDFPCQNPCGRYGFFPGVLHTIFRHGESVWTGFHTNHVSYGDFASSGAERFFAYKFGTRNMDFPREVLISVQTFKIKRHSAGM